MQSTTTEKQERGLAAAVLTLTGARLIVNMTRRFGYPFANPIAQELGVPLLSVQNVLSLQVGIGVTSPAFGSLSEHFGRKRVMLFMLLMMTGAALIGALLPRFGVFAVVMIALGVGKMTYDPTMMAYIGDRVPYHLRARAIAFGELGWAGSLMVAAPLVGFLLDTANLQVVFGVMSVLLLVAALAIWLRLPDDYAERKRNEDGTTAKGFSIRETWAILRRRPAVLGALTYPMFTAIANDIFYINYGVFMEQSFGVQLVALGALTVVIAAAEVVGELSVMGLADRFGKRRVALVGVVVSSFTYLVLPWLNFSLPLALVGIFVMFVFVEISIVAALPIYTEVLPEARSIVMSGVIGMSSLGRLIGGAVGSLAFALTGSFTLLGVLACMVGVAGSSVLWFLLHEQTNP